MVLFTLRSTWVSETQAGAVQTHTSLRTTIFVSLFRTSFCTNIVCNVLFKCRNLEERGF